jgi:hypothetical protein
MFRWSSSLACPCDAAAKTWVEQRLRWLTEHFEAHAFNGRPLVLPTPEFFRDPYDGSKRAVRTLLDRVCSYMDVAPDEVQPSYVDAKEVRPHSGWGIYGFGHRKAFVRIDRSGLNNPIGLVGTMAHDLAHVRLFNQSRTAFAEYDSELLADLTVAFLGLGIFLANTPRNWDSQHNKWPDTNLIRPEYMTPAMFGYALAHLAWWRGEDKPAWARHLNGNARREFEQAMRFLLKTGESAFKARPLESCAEPNAPADRPHD